MLGGVVVGKGAAIEKIGDFLLLAGAQRN